LRGSEVTIPPEYDSQDVQVLKLLQAFFQIEDAATRHLIVALTGSVAKGASDAKHFARQDPSEKKLN
jgi:hypothetical protein